MIIDYNIPKVLISNFDETGLHLTPSSGASFVKVGETKVKSVGNLLRISRCSLGLGHGDKRQITCGVGCNWFGQKFGIQLIFAGKVYYRFVSSTTLLN